MLEFEQAGDRISLVGELQISFLESLHAKLSEVVHHPGPLVLDLSQISEVDLAGLQVLLSFLRTRDNGSATRIVGSPPVLVNALRLVGLEEAFARHMDG